ncbi:MAG: hypothetical protein IJS08_11010 [Victivallales bacterium]|nr:hypothetical protein [Victivallales bacterium]
MKLVDGCIVTGNDSRALHPVEDNLQEMDLFAKYGTSVCGGALRELMDEGDGALQLASLAGSDLVSRNALPQGCGLVLATNFGAASTMSWCWQEKADTGEICQETYEPADDYVRKLAAQLCCTGPACQISMSCASGLAALQVANDMLEAGKANAVLVIAYDEFAGYPATGLKILRTISPEGRVLPFDARRHGTVFGDGAAAALFTKDTQEGKGLGYIIGTATNNNAFHITAPRPEGEGSRQVMAAALKSAGVMPSEIRHVTAHATGTVANDVTEAAALRNLLGDRQVSLTAYKRVIGHKLGAAGLMELLMTVDGIARGNCASPYSADLQPDEKCAPYSSMPATVPASPALLNAAGIGGNNAAAVYSTEKPATRNTTKSTPIYIRSMGWVLPANIGSGAGLLQHPEWLAQKSGGKLTGFNAKEYLSSVKGYMDPASAYLLAACRLALGDKQFSKEESQRTGLCAITQYGCPVSAMQFHKMYIEKGEHASPLLFPHTYANTPTCLAAMEFGLAGPHTIFYGEQERSMAEDFARMRLYEGSADVMLLAQFEAFCPDAFPIGKDAISGAVVYVLSKTPGSDDIGPFNAMLPF